MWGVEGGDVGVVSRNPRMRLVVSVSWGTRKVMMRTVFGEVAMMFWLSRKVLLPSLLVVCWLSRDCGVPVLSMVSTGGVRMAALVMLAWDVRMAWVVLVWMPFPALAIVEMMLMRGHVKGHSQVDMTIAVLLALFHGIDDCFGDLLFGLVLVLVGVRLPFHVQRGNVWDGTGSGVHCQSGVVDFGSAGQGETL